MATILKIDQLKKYYPKVKAVDNISFKVKKGDCFGLLGPNGAGKTTTIEIIETILEPDSGSILYKGKELSESFKQEIGIQFQSTALQEFLTVKETLELFAQLYPKPKAIDEIISICDLEDILNQDNRKLSGGQRQRMLLGIALINDPELLFLDEPTTGLDPHARRNFWTLIENIKNQGKTIILTTHYMDEAERLCDEIVIMDHGQIIERGNPQSLLHKHFSTSTVILPENNIKGIELNLKSEQDNGFLKYSTEDVESTVRSLLEKGIDLAGLVVEKPNLDDLFIKLTGSSLGSS